VTTKVFVCLPYEMDAEAHYQRFLAGFEPEETKYSFHRARELGFEIVFSRRPPDKRSAFQMLLRRALLFDAIHVYRNRRAIADADVVWAMIEAEGFALALLMRLHLVPRRPVIVNCIWIFDQWDLMLAVRKPFYRWLAKAIDRITVHSRGCLPVAERAFGPGRVTLMRFGIDADTFRRLDRNAVADDAPINVLAIGSDNTRDWQTFLEAFGNDARFKARLVCQWVLPADVAPFANVELIVSPTWSMFQTLYAEADFVVVPMKPNVFSGITVALEAAAIGRPVICSATGGIPTYFDDTEVLYVPCGDAEALRAVALNTPPIERERIAERAMARFHRDDYSTRGLMARYAAMTRELLT
jgi:glycosyltransferase involved in cell wall biosynthesis